MLLNACSRLLTNRANRGCRQGIETFKVWHAVRSHCNVLMLPDRMELLSAKNACLKAKLDCEQTRCHLYEKDKIISDLTEEISRLKAQLDTETQNHKVGFGEFTLLSL